jgi:pimeloyl-ACP methyl ester carboxylesterase
MAPGGNPARHPAGRLAGLAWRCPDAPRVLALHGWLDNAASFIPLALPKLDLVALDLPGHGHSVHRHPSARYHFVDYLSTSTPHWMRWLLSPAGPFHGCHRCSLRRRGTRTGAQPGAAGLIACLPAQPTRPPKRRAAAWPSISGYRRAAALRLHDMVRARRKVAELEAAARLIASVRPARPTAVHLAQRPGAELRPRW